MRLQSMNDSSIIRLSGRWDYSQEAYIAIISRDSLLSIGFAVTSVSSIAFAAILLRLLGSCIKAILNR